jgi:hypothetical protein
MSYGAAGRIGGKTTQTMVAAVRLGLQRLRSSLGRAAAQSQGLDTKLENVGSWADEMAERFYFCLRQLGCKRALKFDQDFGLTGVED